jgi:hypothetical protein
MRKLRKELQVTIPVIGVAAVILVASGRAALHGLEDYGKPSLPVYYCPKVGRCGTPIDNIVVGSVIVLGMLLVIYFCLRWIWVARWQQHLHAHGTRVRGVVASCTPLFYPAQMRRRAADPRRLACYKTRVEIPGVPGAYAARSTHLELPKGRQVTLAYDPARPRRRAIIVDDSVY